MTEQNYEQMRRAMVASQLRTTAVNDPRVVAAMNAVPRELHVPVENRAIAYIDRPVPLPGGRELNAPMSTGRLLTEAHVQPEDHVLIVGAATGYSAALLAELAASVVALEENATLLDIARQAVKSDKVRFVEGPLNAGWRKGAPYDLILIDGVVEDVPQAIVDQLAEDGRLATAIVDRGVTRLAIGRRAGKSFGYSAFADADAVPLPGFERPKSFVF